MLDKKSDIDRHLKRSDVDTIFRNLPMNITVDTVI